MRKTLGLALLTAAAVTVPSYGVPPGNTNGAAEQPLLADLAACKALEDEARALAASALSSAPNVKLAGPAKDAILMKVEAARVCLDALLTTIANGGPYQPSTNVDGIVELLEDALEEDTDAKGRLEKGSKPAKVIKDIDDANVKKELARFLVGGMPLTTKEIAAHNAKPVPAGTFIAAADSKAERRPDRPRNPQYGPPERSNAESRALLERALSSGGSDLSLAAVAKPPKNYYFSFEGTTDQGGYFFTPIGRQIFGPFEARFLVGAFDTKKTGDSGSACVEFDLEGSSPLEFLAICGRRINGGIQVFAQSHEGAEGNTFLAGAMVVEVRVEYSGTSFTCSVKPRGAPDGLFAPFATYDYAQGGTALVAGYGASGLKKGAPIGLDEIYIFAK